MAKHITSSVITGFAAAMALWTVASPADANKPLTAAGELSCVVEPAAADQPAGTRDLSCSYKPLTGTASSYTGEVIRMSGPRLTGANLVLIWAVRAPETDLAPESLAGRYIAAPQEGPASSAVKLGSLRRDDGVVPVELHALTPPVSGGQDRTLILELDLRNVKA